MEKGLPGFGGRHSSIGGFVNLLLFPTLLTMCISGLWHGAGYLFILWGAMHGLFLSINHGWRAMARGLWPDRARYARIMTPMGHVITFIAVVAAMVFFRASTVHAAMNIVRGMAGFGGIELPSTMLHRLGAAGVWLQHVGIHATPPDWFPFNEMVAWILILAVIVFFAPNTQQMLAKYEPALGVKASDAGSANVVQRISWKPTLVWAAAVAIVAVVGVLQLSGPSEFLYWQF
jgi:alginate O-acetyltransferase complex protein AlgI